MEQANRRGGRRRRVAFITVESPLGDGDLDSTQRSKVQFTFMPGNCAGGKSFDFFVVD